MFLEQGQAFVTDGLLCNADLSHLENNFTHSSKTLVYFELSIIFSFQMFSFVSYILLGLFNFVPRSIDSKTEWQVFNDKYLQLNFTRKSCGYFLYTCKNWLIVIEIGRIEITLFFCRVHVNTFCYIHQWCFCTLFYFPVISKLVKRGYQSHLQDFLLRLNFNDYYKDT